MSLKSCLALTYDGLLGYDCDIGHETCLGRFAMESLIAYIDGGSGSLLIQVLIAGILGAGVTIRAFWSQIKSKFVRRKSNEGND